MIKLTKKRAASLIGNLLAIAGLVFIVVKLANYGSELNLGDVGSMVWAAMAALALLYGSAGALLALAWHRLLVDLGGTGSFLASLRIYGVSQIAKYVPGNIFHLAGRQSLGIANNLPGWALAKATMWEMILISVAGALSVFLIAPLYVPRVSFIASVPIYLGAVLFSAHILAQTRSRNFGIAFVSLALFHCVSGGIFFLILMLVSGAGNLMVPMFVGAFTIAWLVGFLSPGAPAGVGIREAVLLILLAGEVSENHLLLSTLLSRVVTVIGDFLLFVYAKNISSKVTC